MTKNLRSPIRILIPVTLLEQLITIKEKKEENISVLVTKACNYALKHSEVFECSNEEDE